MAKISILSFEGSEKAAMVFIRHALGDGEDPEHREADIPATQTQVRIGFQPNEPDEEMEDEPDED